MSHKHTVCQIGVFLAYASGKGHALIDRELYLPKEWTDDRERCTAAAVPEAVEFATKPRLAQRMIERALTAGVPVSWVLGDEVYGNDRRLRLWLEQHDRPHVLAVKATEPLWALVAGQGAIQVPARDLATACKCRVNLLITHISECECRAEHNVGQSYHAAPQDSVAGQWISGAGEPAAQSGDLPDVA